ncbi:hypothetical protein ERHA54_50020 (plasmid) [Erwinia rhapontici]|nr:hypothetical protein ERHA54_50020 [Erwinia rhapontici]
MGVKTAIRDFSKRAPFVKGTQCRNIVIVVALKHELIFFHFTDESQSDIFLFINKVPEPIKYVKCRVALFAT